MEYDRGIFICMCFCCWNAENQKSPIKSSSLDKFAMTFSDKKEDKKDKKGDKDKGKEDKNSE